MYLLLVAKTFGVGVSVLRVKALTKREVLVSIKHLFLRSTTKPK